MLYFAVVVVCAAFLVAVAFVYKHHQLFVEGNQDRLHHLSDYTRGQLRVGKVDLSDERSEPVQNVLIALFVSPGGNKVELHDLLR